MWFDSTKSHFILDNVIMSLYIECTLTLKGEVMFYIVNHVDGNLFVIDEKNLEKCKEQYADDWFQEGYYDLEGPFTEAVIDHNPSISGDQS